MTNEELVQQIQGGNDSLLHTLWEQIEKFASMQAGKTARNLAGYAERGTLFLTWYGYFLRTAFADVGGYRTTKTSPLRRAVSLDTPLPGTDDFTLADTIADPTDEYEAAECRVWLEQLRHEIDKAMGTLPDGERDTLHLRFWRGETLAAAGEQMGVSPEQVRQRERKGLQRLRRPKCAEPLREFLEERTNYYRSMGATAFQRIGSSAVELEVIRRRKMEERYCDRGRT